MNRPRWTTWLARGILFTAVLAASLLAAELYVRLTSTRVLPSDQAPVLGAVQSRPDRLVADNNVDKRLIPGSDVVIHNHNLSQRDIRVRVNAHGFRDDELTVPRPTDELRILAIGDSITWGDYLQADEVWVQQAEQHLAAAWPDLTVQVVNGGLGDQGLAEEVEILAERGVQVQPQHVVVAFYLNDSRPPWGFPGELGAPGFFRNSSALIDSVYRNAMLRGWVKVRGGDRFMEWVSLASKRDWADDTRSFDRLVHAAQFDWGAAWDAGSWDTVERQLDTLEDLAEEHDFTVSIVIFPVRFQVDARFLDDAPQRTLGAIAAQRGIPTLDLLPLMREHRGRLLFLDHCHPTVYGNAIIGAEVATFLQRVAVEPSP